MIISEEKCALCGCFLGEEEVELCDSCEHSIDEQMHCDQPRNGGHSEAL